MVQIHGIRRASADAKYRQMTGQPVKPLILKLCLPAVISNLVTTAYNLTDTFFIGQLGTAQSGAIGIAFSIMTVMQALGFFFGNGAGNSMSRELGKQNNDRASRLLAVGFAGGVLAMNGTNFTDLAAGSTTGISGGFLAALLAGFAAGYIVQFLKKITEKLPASLNGIRPMLIYPLGGILIVGAMMCAVNPVMGMINTATTDWLNALGGSSKVLLGAIVAGMMSVDMGGPVNKAAYVFGTAALASGNYEVMAAVMVGGMVPPIAIALSTTFCPRKWTLDERRNGIVNYVMGLCFVSEGAIPYAAADPLRVLPSCVVGSAVAGALSMTFGCALRAPHGGIFVFPVVDHAALYCVALAVGSVLGAVILSLIKKTQPAEAK